MKKNLIIDTMNFGDIIQYFRTRLNLTQKELAEITKYYSENYISLLETGKRTPSVKAMIVLSKALNIDPSYFSLDNLSLGDKIKYLRWCKGYTQSAFAKKLEIPSLLLSYIEKDTVIPNNKLIAKIANSLNMNVDGFLQFSLETCSSRKKYMFIQEKKSGITENKLNSHNKGLDKKLAYRLLIYLV